MVQEPRIAQSKVILIYDNARPPTAQLIQPLLKHFHWKWFEHPQYSMDLVPSDYHLFSWLKKE